MKEIIKDALTLWVTPSSAMDTHTIAQHYVHANNALIAFIDGKLDMETYLDTLEMYSVDMDDYTNIIIENTNLFL